MSRWRKAAGLATLPLIIVLLAGCGAAGKSVFPKSGAVAGWSQGESATLTGEGLAGLSADAAAGYAVESVERQAYVKTSGEQIDVQVWRMADAGEAYGLWSALRGGEPVDGIGNNADSDGARRLAFWQERYFVQALAGQDVPEADLAAFGKALAQNLPRGGQPPALVTSLPKDGLDPWRTLYFHTEASLASTLDLGGENRLGLSQKTNGVLGSYTLEGQTYRLLLVDYPAGSDSNARGRVLQNLGLPGLLVAGVKDQRLGAVFGEQSGTEAVTLLQEALSR